jgi:LuxR family maltose regulon positive regulatory protein
MLITNRRISDLKEKQERLQSEEMTANTSMQFQDQLLTTKFFVPAALGPLISRSYLTTLLSKSLQHSLTLISAPAGFGKTTLLAAWTQSLPVNHPFVAWVSLDEEDNDPRLFWTYILAALNRQQPEHFSSLLMELQSQQTFPLKYLLNTLINLLSENTTQFLLILDDYQVITEPEIHTTLAYLVEHLPAQLRLILSTRADPPLPLSLLRSRQQIVEVRTNQLRCTAEETRTFFEQVMGIQLPEKIIQEVTARTEGWLVGLHLLGLSLGEQINPATLLQEVSGDQRYFLDYLTEVVLGRQPQEVQTFLLSTCMLERLTASLCDAVTQHADSQQMLQWLEQANLFVVALDSKREWYRYHALFAEALSCQLEKTQPDLAPILHHRASLWYAQHDQILEAILHAFRAKEWQWAADLIEGLPLLSLAWGADEYRLMMLKEWLEQLPADVVGVGLASVWPVLRSCGRLPHIPCWKLGSTSPRRG